MFPTVPQPPSHPDAEQTARSRATVFEGCDPALFNNLTSKRSDSPAVSTSTTRRVRRLPHSCVECKRQKKRVSESIRASHASFIDSA